MANSAKETFRKNILSPFKFSIFKLQKLPMAWIAGLKVLELEEEHAVVSVPYKWLNQNPFKSTYFACLAMAGELSTGVLVLLKTVGNNPPISTLVVNLKAEFVKTATDYTYFTCADGAKIQAAVDEAIQTGQGVTVETLAIGKNKAGEEVCRFYVTWSMKVRRKK